MKAKEIIESGLLELYVLGQCTEEENQTVEAHLDNDAIAAEIKEIEESLFQLASLQATNPAPSLRSKVFEAIDGQPDNTKKSEAKQEAPKVVPLPSQQTSRTQWWLRAAVIALLVSLGVNGFFASQLSIAKQQLAQSRTVNSVLAGEMDVIQSSYEKTQQLNQVFAEGVVHSVALKAADKGNQSAHVYWDEKSGQAMVNAKNLPALSEDQSYQLWCLIDGKPMDMGVIPTDKVGQSELAMLKKSTMKPDAFAITVEPYGGKPQPTLENLKVLGNVNA